MISDLLQPALPVWNLLLRAVVVYLAVLILLRLAGKRQLAQMSPTEFVAILLVSNAVQNAMNGGDNSLGGGLVLAVVLIAVSRTISWLTYRYGRARLVFEGSPTLIVYRGRPIRDHMAREHLAPSELRALLREQGFERLRDVHSAVLEADGHLSVIRAAAGRRGRGRPDPLDD